MQYAKLPHNAFDLWKITVKMIQTNDTELMNYVLSILKLKIDYIPIRYT